jgi:hypothetical protein
LTLDDLSDIWNRQVALIRAKEDTIEGFMLTIVNMGFYQIQHVIEKTNSDLEDTFLRLGLIDERYYQGSDLCIDLDRYWIYYIFYG